MASLKLSPNRAPKWEARVRDDFDMKLKEQFSPHANDWSKPVVGPSVEATMTV